MNKNKILVSAIVSTFNSEKFIRSRIENLLQQTLADKLEIVIVNSGSKQNEDKIVSEYLFKHPNIKYIRTKERETIYKAWNRGIKLSEGRYITNANTDDHLRNDALEIFSDYLDRNADVVLVYADYYITNLPDQNFNNTNGLRLQSNKDFNKLLLLESCYIGPQPMWRADVHFKDNIWFDESLEIAGDYEFECNLAQRYKFHHIKNPLGIYYKSIDKTNKEYQNLSRTFIETYNVSYKYTDLYINSLSNSTLKKLNLKLNIKLAAPQLIYKVINKFLEIFFPCRTINSKQFNVWFKSIVLEKRNQVSKAKAVCVKFLKRNNSPLINYRLEILIKRYEN